MLISSSSLCGFVKSISVAKALILQTHTNFLPKKGKLTVSQSNIQYTASWSVLLSICLSLIRN